MLVKLITWENPAMVVTVWWHLTVAILVLYFTGLRPAHHALCLLTMVLLPQSMMSQFQNTPYMMNPQQTWRLRAHTCAMGNLCLAWRLLIVFKSQDCSSTLVHLIQVPDTGEILLLPIIVQLVWSASSTWSMWTPNRGIYLAPLHLHVRPPLPPEKILYHPSLIHSPTPILCPKVVLRWGTKTRWSQAQIHWTRSKTGGFLKQLSNVLWRPDTAGKAAKPPKTFHHQPLRPQQIIRILVTLLVLRQV